MAAIILGQLFLYAEVIECHTDRKCRANILGVPSLRAMEKNIVTNTKMRKRMIQDIMKKTEKQQMNEVTITAGKR